MSTLFVLFLFVLGALTLLFFLSRRTITLIYLFVYQLTGSESAASIVVAVIFFPGTVVHELSHFLAALALMLKVHEFNLIPRWNKHSIVLGHVTYRRRDPIRGFLVGIAPLFGGLGVLWLIFQAELFAANSLLIVVGTAYLVFSIASTMFSSKQDLVDAGVIIPLVMIGLGVAWFFPGIVEFFTSVFILFASGRESLVASFLASTLTICGFTIVAHLILLAAGTLIPRR